METPADSLRQPSHQLSSPPYHHTILSKGKKILPSFSHISIFKQIQASFKTFGVSLEILYKRDKTHVPVIVIRLCEYLKLYGLKKEGLFRVNGNKKVVDRLKAEFDQNGDADLEEMKDISAVASLLKMFLRELEEPVVSNIFLQKLISVHKEHGKDKKHAAALFQEVFLQMPTLNINLFEYLCEFLLQVLDEAESNRMTPLSLAIVFGPNLFWCGEGSDGLQEQKSANAVLLTILEHYENFTSKDSSMPPRVIDLPENLTWWKTIVIWGVYLCINAQLHSICSKAH